jgi:hypothetical protein
MRPLPLPLALLLLLCCVPIAGANTTATWLTKRDQFIGAVYGNGDGVLPTQSAPNWTLTYPSDPSPGLQGLVWDLQGKFFPINATAFFSPVTPGKKAKSAFLFHHGHSNCVCAAAEGDTPIVAAKCRPGCNSSMPSLDEIGDPGYSWWDLYNTSDFLHSLGHDVFILSMPLKGVNLGPGSNDTYLATDHEWFRQWEEQGDSPLRYFMEPTYLTVNYAKAAGYEQIYMAGLSGGGWSTTFAAAIDKRIDASFPIAGSLPCDMRNPESWDHPQSWTGDSDEDYEQSCRPNRTDPHPDPTGYACRPTKTNPHPPCPDAKPVRACLFSCLRLAAPLSHLLPTARTWLVPPLTRWRCCRYIGPPGVPLLQLHVPVLAGRAGAGTVPDADSPRIRHVLLLATQSAWKTKNARHLTRTVSEQHTRQFLTHTHWPHVTSPVTPQVREQHSSRANGRRTSAWRWAWVVYSDCR